MVVESMADGTPFQHLIKIKNKNFICRTVNTVIMTTQSYHIPVILHSLYSK